MPSEKTARRGRRQSRWFLTWPAALLFEPPSRIALSSDNAPECKRLSSQGGPARPTIGNPWAPAGCGASFCATWRCVVVEEQDGAAELMLRNEPGPGARHDFGTRVDGGLSRLPFVKSRSDSLL
jgi:hypothetical protein